MYRTRLTALILALVFPLAAAGEEEADAPFQRPNPNGPAGRVYKAQIEPHWSSDGAHFWYRNDLSGGRREYVLVDAARGERKIAFDHQRLAKAIGMATGRDVDAERLLLHDLEFDLAAKEVIFFAEGKSWRCPLESYEIREEPDRVPKKDGDRGQAPRPRVRNGEEMDLSLVNRTAAPVQLFWIPEEGSEQSYGKIAAGQTREQHTYSGHRWEVRDEQGKPLLRFAAGEDGTEVIIREGAAQERPRDERQRRAGPRDRRGSRDESPDGKWTAFTRDNNLFVRSTDDGQEFQLSQDGEAGKTYQQPQWSPDSQSLVAFRVTPGDRKDVYLIESSPRGGGRAKLRTHAYDLPGDKFTSHELCLFRIADRSRIPCDIEPVDFGWPQLRWRMKGAAFTYEKVDRGHQRFRVIEVDAGTGAARNLIDEKTETFIWTAHTESMGVPPVTWLEHSEELIYVSERDGWRHLYLVDADAGEIKNQITRGEYVIRGIDRIDEEKRQIWFHASGKHVDQDPYLIHYFRVDFDGGNLVPLTEGNGTHTVQFSPDRQYLIDTYSRVDLAPVHELRRADGQLLCELERSDVTELEASGWKAPEVFHAKGRDGKTDIWGIICRPRDFDPAKKYPILEDIYAGPHGSFVPKSFSARDRYRSLNDRGFVVVKIDGMGTAHRSKAFHDVCWHNLKDGGFEDRILWMKAAAAKDPALDVTRVGVYGTSAGGQNAAAAVLFHPEFYKAAVANCGCHDNRMDKASWNEQWMGYPVGPWYAECSNIDNAHRLQGKLMLVVGELDTNVPPESTYRLVDALIKAGKDFDFLLIPGGGHGAGGAYGQRRLEDFFVRHLQGDDFGQRATATSTLR